MIITIIVELLKENSVCSKKCHNVKITCKILMEGAGQN